MKEKEEEQMEECWEELVDVVSRAMRRENGTSEDWVQFGYQRAARDEIDAKLLRHLVFRYEVQPLAGMEIAINKQFFFAGLGYLHGLKESKQISARQMGSLLDRLKEAIEPDVDVANPPAAESSETASMGDAKAPDKASEDDVWVRLFEYSLQAEPTTLRARGYLVQYLRQSGYAKWMTVRKALYETETLLSERRLMMQEVQAFLPTKELAELVALCAAISSDGTA